MKVRRFMKVDLPFLQDWLMNHYLSHTLSEQLPSLGFIVENQGSRIAAGFIRKMENSKMGYVDGFITNPTETSEHRDKALDLLTETLLLKAKDKGFEGLLCKSTEINILKRGLRHGFEVLPHVMMGKNL